VLSWEVAAPESSPCFPAFAGRRDQLVRRSPRCHAAKTGEDRVWGVQHIWLIEPELKRIRVCDKGSIQVPPSKCPLDRGAIALYTFFTSR
jgi:hypothetical protein